MRLFLFTFFLFAIKLLPAQPPFGAKYMYSMFNVPSGPYTMWESRFSKDTTIDDTIFFNTDRQDTITSGMFFYNNAYYDYVSSDTTIIFDQNAVKGDTFQVIELEYNYNSGSSDPRRGYDTALLRVDSVYLMTLEGGQVRKVWKFSLSDDWRQYTWIEEFLSSS